MSIIATEVLFGKWNEIDQVQLFRLFKVKKLELLSHLIILSLNYQSIKVNLSVDNKQLNLCSNHSLNTS